MNIGKKGVIVLIGVLVLFFWDISSMQPQWRGRFLSGGITEFDFKSNPDTVLARFVDATLETRLELDLREIFPVVAARTNVVELVRSLQVMFGKIFTKHHLPYEDQNHEGLRCCSCAASPLGLRIALVLMQAESLLVRFPVKNLDGAPLVHTAFGAGELLQTYALIFALASVGYDNLHINIIEPSRGNIEEVLGVARVLIQRHIPDKNVLIFHYQYAQDYIAAVRSGNAPHSHSFDKVDVESFTPWGIKKIDEVDAGDYWKYTGIGLFSTDQFTSQPGQIANIYMRNCAQDECIKMIKVSKSKISANTKHLSRIANKVHEPSSDETREAKDSWISEKFDFCVEKLKQVLAGFDLGNKAQVIGSLKGNFAELQQNFNAGDYRLCDSSSWQPGGIYNRAPLCIGIYHLGACDFEVMVNETKVENKRPIVFESSYSQSLKPKTIWRYNGPVFINVEEMNRFDNSLFI